MPSSRLVNDGKELPQDRAIVDETLELSDGDTNVNVPGISSIDHVYAEVEANQGTDMVQVTEGDPGTIDVTMTSIADASASSNTNNCTVIAVGKA